MHKTQQFWYYLDEKVHPVNPKGWTYMWLDDVKGKDDHAWGKCSVRIRSLPLQVTFEFKKELF